MFCWFLNSYVLDKIWKRFYSEERSQLNWNLLKSLWFKKVLIKICNVGGGERGTLSVLLPPLVCESPVVYVFRPQNRQILPLFGSRLANNACGLDGWILNAVKISVPLRRRPFIASKETLHANFLVFIFLVFTFKSGENYCLAFCNLEERPLPIMKLYQVHTPQNKILRYMELFHCSDVVSFT